MIEGVRKSNIFCRKDNIDNENAKTDENSISKICIFA
jgi:hypothetical protein